MKSYNGGSLGVGIITIFTVLIVLCLSVFAMLTLSSAQADLHLSEINAKTVSAYYAADIKAQRLYNEFSAGDATELSEDIYITEAQCLHIHLMREGETVSILEWNTAPSAEIEIDYGINLWDGVFSG